MLSMEYESGKTEKAIKQSVDRRRQEQSERQPLLRLRAGGVQPALGMLNMFQDFQ